MTAAVASDARTSFEAAYASSRAAAGVTEGTRAAAWARFAELGFPGGRDEAWKYTNLRRLQSRRFEPAEPTSAAAVEVDLDAGPRVTLLDGRLLPGATGLPGVRVRGLAEALAQHEPQSQLLRVPSGGGTERFVALNAALAPDVVLIDVEAGASVDRPLHVVIAATPGASRMSHPRLLIRAGAGSSARIVLHHADAGAEHFVNGFAEVEVGADADLHIYRLQGASERAFLIERIEATVAQRGRLVLHDAQLGASLARLDVFARLVAPGASAELSGLFVADGTRHVDAQLRVDHLARETASLVDYRGIAAGRGRGVFNGKAVVHVDAQQSRARQTSRNLLLTAGAEIDTKPELEIYADDVQCSHGATTGQLDPAALFYLRSRGLDERQARTALTRAFAAAVLSRMDLPAYAGAVHAALDERLSRLLEIEP